MNPYAGRRGEYAWDVWSRISSPEDEPPDFEAMANAESPRDSAWVRGAIGHKRNRIFADGLREKTKRLTFYEYRDLCFCAELAARLGL